jgi:glycine cleavage system H protein
MPVGGEIAAANSALEESPEKINASPYSDGWMIAVKPDDPAELEALMTSDDYLKSLKG